MVDMNISFNMTKYWFEQLGFQLFGLPLYMGIFGVSFLIYLLGRNHAPLEFYIIIVVPFIFTLTGMGYLPAVLKPLILLGLALGWGIGITKMFTK